MSSYGTSTRAWFVEPDRPARPAQHSRCAVLFVHWYEPEAGDSNRNQYLREALPLAEQDGCVSLLVDTMWSKPEWFRNRDAARDLEESEAQIRNLGAGARLFAGPQGCGSQAGCLRWA